MIIKSFDMSVDYAGLSSNQPNETAKLSLFQKPYGTNARLLLYAPAADTAQGQAERRRRLCLNTALPDFMDSFSITQ